MNLVLIAITVVLAGLRVSGENGQAYQAAAHLFLGWLIGAAWFEWKSSEHGTWNAPSSDQGESNAALKVGLVVALSVVEVGCFVWFKLFA